VHFYLNIIISSEVVPRFSRKPPKLRQEPTQHNIDPSKLVEGVCPIPGNGHQPQHNDHICVFTCNYSPTCQCVCCSSQQAKLKNLKNEYDERKDVATKSKTPIVTNKKQTELLSGIFGISPAQFSQIINTWVKMLTATLPSDTPKIFQKPWKTTNRFA